MMKVKSLAPWFGGKRTLAPAIVEQLGPHTQYFEPFCGSMAVLFAKPQSQKETVNDLHGDLINLAKVVQDEFDAPWLFDRLQRTLMSEGLLQEAQSYFREMPEDVDNCGGNRERAYWYFVASWMGRNGAAGTQRLDYQIAVRWTKSGGSPTVRWRNAVESLPAWHRRLQNVVILRRDAMQIIDRFEDCPQTAIYADPPYLHSTRSNHHNKSGGTGRYLHDFDESAGGLFSAEDPHSELAGALRRYQQARIVVSYYDHPRLAELYPEWTKTDHRRQKHLHAQNGRGVRPKDAPEVLLVNGPAANK